MKISEQYEYNLTLLLSSLEALVAHSELMGLPDACPVKHGLKSLYSAACDDFEALTEPRGALHLLNTGS